MHRLETHETVLASVNTSGTGGGNANVGSMAISSNGQFVVFATAASNLVPDDTNDTSDIFLRDLEASTTTLVSADLAGGSPRIHAKNQPPAFRSSAHLGGRALGGV